MEVNIELIKPSPHQPRIIFDLDEIKGSVERDGILVPLTVRKKDDYYELIDGERRWRVSKELGFKTVPCTVIDVDDVTADRMAWKVNTLRRDYGPKEKAYHFREHQKEGSTLRGIADTHDLDQRMVKAYLNVFKLPEKYQELVWNREISIGIILELGSLLNGEYSPLNRPEVLGILDRASKEKYFGARDVREIIKPYLARVRREQVEKAQQTLSEIEPEVKAPETPEEFERASRVLRFEAKKKREELLTPEERAKIEIEKRGKEEERRRRAEERERRLEEEAVRRARQIEEEERRRIEEEARKRAVEEELRRPEVLREAAKRYDEMRKRELEKTPRREQAEIPLPTFPEQVQSKLTWNMDRIDMKKYDFFTIGYSERGIEQFIELLQKAGVHALVDVRRDPVSQFKPEFSKDKLGKALEERGIKYAHHPSLGVPRDVRLNLAKSEDYDLFFKWYDDNVIADLSNYLDEVMKLGNPLAFMCVEFDPRKCHRHRITLALEKRGLRGLDL